jgi:hypothetical protein
MKIRWIFFNFILLYSASLCASDNISIEQKENGKIEIIAADCETIKKQIAAIQKWKEKFPLEKNVNQNINFENSTSGCSADITSILPKFALDWHDKEGKNDGPNCWNTALYMSGVVDVVRYTGEQEFSFWMNSPLCKELDQNAPVEAGDLLVERGETGEQHVSVFISDELIFEKIGFEKQLQYQLTNTPNMTPETSEYGSKFCGKIKGQHPKECNLGWYNSFRCQSMEEYIKNNPGKELDELTYYDKTLGQIECNLQEQIKNSSSTTLDTFSEEMLNVIQNLATSESQKSADDFLWRSLKHRVDSLRSQINIIKKSRPN